MPPTRAGKTSKRRLPNHSATTAGQQPKCGARAIRLQAARSPPCLYVLLTHHLPEQNCRPRNGARPSMMTRARDLTEGRKPKPCHFTKLIPLLSLSLAAQGRLSAAGSGVESEGHTTLRILQPDSPTPLHTQASRTLPATSMTSTRCPSAGAPRPGPDLPPPAQPQVRTHLLRPHLPFHRHRLLPDHPQNGAITLIRRIFSFPPDPIHGKRSGSVQLCPGNFAWRKELAQIILKQRALAPHKDSIHWDTARTRAAFSYCAESKALEGEN